ncbi:MAG: hypothetical protein GX062_04760 [Firmicutes bacterium]|nr:hypothetical protein [Bacillota bacterium]
MGERELTWTLKGILKTGDTVSFLAAENLHVIGTTGEIVKLMSDQGVLRLLSFVQLAQFAAEGRLFLNGIKYTPRG